MPQEESVLRLGRDEALEAARLWQECGDAREFACRVLGSVMNALMDSEAQQMCGASRNERSDGRENSRNGYRPRSLKTAVGDVELEIPKLRHGTYYPEGMLARWSRVDTSVAAIVQEMYVCGVSTRKVERVASKLGISSLSSSEVSSLCSDLDAEVAEFRRRDLSGTPCCYLWLDATYMSCRVGSSVVSQGVVTAIGLGADGRKHFLGCDVVDTESEDSWAAFLGGLRERGLAGVRLVVSDSHAGLVAAVSRLFQGCAWQRCVTHLQRNLQSACSGRPRTPRRPSGTSCTPRSTRTTPTSRAACGPRRRPGWRRCPPGPARSSSRPRTPRWRSRPSPGRTGPSSAPTTSRSAPTARSSAATGSCSPSPRGSRCCA